MRLSIRYLLRRLTTLIDQSTAHYPYNDFCLITGGRLHLVGSLQMASQKLAHLPSELLQRLKQADTLVVESNLLADQDPAEQCCPAAPRAALAKRLNEQAYSRLLQCCQTVNLPLSRIDRLPYWEVALILQSYQASRNGLFTEYGTDYQLLVEAQERAIPIVELEDQAIQQVRLQRLPEEGLLLLQATLQQWSQGAQAMKQAEIWWLSGQASPPPLLEALHYGLHRLLITDRYTAWSARLQQLPLGNHLAVVGVPYLFGPDGLFKALAAYR